MRKRVRILFVLINLMVLVMINGCSNKKQEGDNQMTQNQNDENQEDSEKLATKEFVMEIYALTEEDLEGIDVEKIIEYYAMAEEVISLSKRENIVGFLKDLQDDIEEEIEDSKYDFEYLVNAKEYEGEYPSFGDIKYLAYFQSEGDGGYSFLFDFENDNVFFASGGRGVYEDYRKASATYKLTEELKKQLIAVLETAKVEDWEYHYEEDIYPEPVNWNFGMEFKDGTVISHSGVTAAPESQGDVEKVMESILIQN